MLELSHVSHRYHKTPCLEDVSFSVGVNEFFVLLGLNGAGKSTIFSLLTRLQSLQQGVITIDGHDLGDYAKALRRIGIVFQEPTLDLDLTVRQNLYYYGALKGLGRKRTLQSIESELTVLGVEPHLDTRVLRLSGGHRRRVEIVRALIDHPRLLLLDEATVGLDVETRFGILDYLRAKVREGVSVLWITHLHDEVQPTDGLAILHKGKVLATGDVAQVVADAGASTITDAFAAMTGVRHG